MNKFIFWGFILLLALGVAFVISDTLAPFLISFIFAYLLQPVIEVNCEKFGLPRWAATLGVFTLFLGGFIAILVLLVPVIYQQLADFVKKIPQYKANIEEMALNWSDSFDSVDPEITQKISDSAHSFVNSTFSVFGTLANHVWEYTLATINFFVIIALVPVVLFYFLRDWPKMVKSIESLYPVKGKSKIRQIFTSINELLSAYIRGQLNICLILTIYYSIGLHFIGLDLALLLGILSGFLIIIPFVGAVLSFILVVISCYFSFGAGMELVYITILFILGHTIEGYILTPKIIGDRIGLHPLWVLFAVFAAGSLFGFLGVLFAIPIAGIIKVLFSYMIDSYKSSTIYKD